LSQDTKIHIEDFIGESRTQGVLVATLIDGNSSVVAVSNIGIEYSFRTKIDKNPVWIHHLPCSGLTSIRFRKARTKASVADLGAVAWLWAEHASSPMSFKPSDFVRYIGGLP
jgi:hypothetical protein